MNFNNIIESKKKLYRKNPSKKKKFDPKTVLVAIPIIFVVLRKHKSFSLYHLEISKLYRGNPNKLIWDFAQDAMFSGTSLGTLLSHSFCTPWILRNKSWTIQKHPAFRETLFSLRHSEIQVEIIFFSNTTIFLFSSSCMSKRKSKDDVTYVNNAGA